MRFYTFNVNTQRPDLKVYLSAYLAPEMQGAEFIPDGGNTTNVFKRPKEESIDNYSFVEDVPLFDYFILKENYGSSRKKFDWIKLDVYGFVVGHYTLGYSVNSQLKVDR